VDEVLEPPLGGWLAGCLSVCLAVMPVAVAGSDCDVVGRRLLLLLLMLGWSVCSLDQAVIN